MASHLRSRLILGGNAMISASSRRFTQASRRSLPSRRMFSLYIPERNDQEGPKRLQWWLAWIGYRRDGTPRDPYTLGWSVVLVGGFVGYIWEVYVEGYFRNEQRKKALPEATAAFHTLLEDVQTIDRGHYAHTDFSDFESSSQYFEKLVLTLDRGQKPMATLFRANKLFDYQDGWLDVIGALARKRDPEQMERARAAIAFTCEKIHELLCEENAEKNGPHVTGREMMVLILQALVVLAKLHLPENGRISG